ncbi:MAG TPA: Gfo/Idh/MocA family oxidoreductase [Pirellula sp.]|nr:Gfo/Idh/MocA family oxidoreductase [Pirellula sp.]
MTQSKRSRRNFLKTTAATSALGTSIPYFSWTEKAFANQAKNDRPRIGCIGVGSMGSGDAKGHSNFGDILAVCDVDKDHLEKAKSDPQIGKGTADAYEDYRKVLDRKDIDVVSIVTCDHWHVKIAVEALQAGKHVFCQKPLTLTLEENQLIRNACKKYPNLVFTVGTQQRDARKLFLRAVNMVQKGLLGKIHTVTCSIGGGDVAKEDFVKTTPPSSLNWDMWLGQAPKVDYIKERAHYQFRWWYEYSGGKFTDWGAHHIDIATWALGEDKPAHGPIEIDGTDAKHPVPYSHGYATTDLRYNTAHDYVVKCKYASGVTLNVTSGGNKEADADTPRSVGNGILFEGDKGRIFVSRGKISGKPIEEEWDKDTYTDEDVVRLYKGKPHEGHKNNFFRCVREGGLPLSDVFTHVQAMGTCHLSAIAARLNRVIKWDPKAEKIIGDEEAAKFFAREQRKGYEINRV